LGKEHRRLAVIATLATALRRAEDELAGARELEHTADDELAEMARDDIARLQADIERLEAELVPALVPRDPLDDRPAIVEIRAGTGGDEAALFAADLHRMYMRYAERHA